MSTPEHMHKLIQIYLRQFQDYQKRSAEPITRIDVQADPHRPNSGSDVGCSSSQDEWTQSF